MSGARNADGSIAVADVAVDKGKALALAPHSPNVMRLVVVMVCMLVWLSFFLLLLSSSFFKTTGRTLPVVSVILCSDRLWGAGAPEINKT